MKEPFVYIYVPPEKLIELGNAYGVANNPNSGHGTLAIKHEYETGKFVCIVFVSTAFQPGIVDGRVIGE